MIFHVRVAQSAGGIIFHSSLAKFQIIRNQLLRDPISTMTGSIVSAVVCVVSIAMFTQPATAHSVSSR